MILSAINQINDDSEVTSNTPLLITYIVSYDY